MPDKEKSELEKAMQTAEKAAAGIPPEAMKAAAAAQTAAGIMLPADNDLQQYIESIIAAISYPEMNAIERAAYLQAVKALNVQLKENAAQLSTLINADLINKTETANYFINGTLLQVYEILDNILSCYQSNAFTMLSALFPDMNAFFAGTKAQQENIIDLYALLEFCQQLQAAEPFAAAEVESYKKEKGIETVTFIQFQNDILPRCLEKAEQLRKNPKKFAQENGAITTIGKRLLIPSAPDYQSAFMTKIQSKGGFFALSEQTDKKTGKKKEVRSLALNINIPFIQGLFNATWINYSSGDKTGRTRVYFPDFAKELGLDFKRKKGANGEKGETRKESRQRIMQQFIIQTSNIYGTIPGKRGYFQLFNTPWYDPETEWLEFESPYMKELIEANIRLEQKAIIEKKPYEWKCNLMHASAANERNKAAVEMAQRVLVGVQQRGTTVPDSKTDKYKGTKLKDKEVFSWEISCAGLIEDCPIIREQLKRQANNNGRTVAIKRAFTAMYKILRTKSDLFTFYYKLEINEVIPVYSTLYDENSFIKIKHYGRNPNYVRPLLLLPDGSQTDGNI